MQHFPAVQQLFILQMYLVSFSFVALKKLPGPDICDLLAFYGHALIIYFFAF